MVDWSKATEAEGAVVRVLEEQAPKTAQSLNLQSCTILEQEYSDAVAELQACWQDNNAPHHACQALAVQVRNLRQKLLAAGFSLTPNASS